MSLLWVSFILFSSYLMVSISALTPNSLVLGAGIQIPIVAINVGLAVYGMVSPLLVCLFGIYVYVQIEGLLNHAPAGGYLATIRASATGVRNMVGWNQDDARTRLRPRRRSSPSAGDLPAGCLPCARRPRAVTPQALRGRGHTAGVPHERDARHAPS